MDTSNSLNSFSDPGSFRVWDLLCSEDRGDRAVAAKAQHVVEHIVENLKPIFRYVTVPVVVVFVRPSAEKVGSRVAEYRAIPLDMPDGIFTNVSYGGGRGELFLDDHGNLFVSHECNDQECIAANGKHYHGRSGSGLSVWGNCPFNLLIEKLSSAMKRAEIKREEHLVAVRERTKLLNSIEALLKK